jgi:hypothetical protein
MLITCIIIKEVDPALLFMLPGEHSDKGIQAAVNVSTLSSNISSILATLRPTCYRLLRNRFLNVDVDEYYPSSSSSSSDLQYPVLRLDRLVSLYPPSQNPSTVLNFPLAQTYPTSFFHLPSCFPSFTPSILTPSILSSRPSTQCNPPWALASFHRLKH